MKLRPTRGSGCGLVEKGDLYSRFLHVEVKTTRVGDTPIAAWWFKAVSQAQEQKRRQTVLLLELPPDRCMAFNAWAVLHGEFYDFLRTVDALQNAVRRSGNFALYFGSVEKMLSIGRRGRYNGRFAHAGRLDLVQLALLSDRRHPDAAKHPVVLMPRIALPTGPELEQLLQDPRCPTI